jgi:hypothetical protein
MIQLISYLHFSSVLLPRESGAFQLVTFTQMSGGIFPCDIIPEHPLPKRSNCKYRMSCLETLFQDRQLGE